MVFIKKTTATVLALVVGAAAYRPSTYPEYCSESGSTDEINGADRQIPALSASEADLVDELIQV